MKERGVLWLGLAFCLVAGYRWLPDHIHYFRHLDELAWGLFLMGVFWFLLASLGSFWVGRWLAGGSADGEGPRSRLSRILFSAGLGIGIYSGAMLLWGIGIGVSAGKIVAFHLVLAACSIPGSIGVLREGQGVVCSICGREWKPLELLALCGLGVAMFTLLPFAAAPAAFPDTLRYHFGLTQLYQNAGRIAFFPDFAESNLSSNWQMIFMGQIFLGGEMLAQVFTWSVLGVFWLCLGALLPLRRALFACGLCLAIPFFPSLFTLSNNDSGVALMTALVWLALRRGEGKKSWMLAGIFSGIVFGVKYSSLLFIVAMLPAHLVLGMGTMGRKWGHFVVFVLGMTLGYAPWFVKNTVWTGDPIYPTLSQKLPWALEQGVHVTQTYARELKRYGGGMEGWARAAAGLWRATTEDSSYFDGELGVLLWGGLPLLIFAVWRKPEVRWEAMTFLGFLVLWSIGPQITRLLGAGVFVFVVALERMLSGVWKTPSWRIPFGLGLSGLMGAGLWISWLTMVNLSNPHLYWLMRQSRDHYLEGVSPSYKVAKWLDQDEHRMGKVLLIGVDEISFFKTPIRYSGPFDLKWIVEQAAGSKSPEDLLEKVKGDGIRYLFIDPAHAHALDSKFGYFSWPTKESEQVFIAFFKEHTRLVERYPMPQGNGFRELREILP